MGQAFNKLCCECFVSDEQQETGREMLKPMNTLTTPTPDNSSHAENGGRFTEELQAACEAFTTLLFREDLDSLKSTDAVAVTGCDEEKGFSIKTEWKSEFSPRQFLDYYYVVEERPKWDTNISSVQQDEDLVYTRFKKVGIVSERDLLTVSQEFVFRDGLLCVSSSVHSPEFEVPKNTVRIQLDCGGYFVRENEEGGSDVVMISKIDIGGNLPKTMIKKMTAITMPKLVKGINTHMKKYLSKSHE